MRILVDLHQTDNAQGNAVGYVCYDEEGRRGWFFTWPHGMSPFGALRAIDLSDDDINQIIASLEEDEEDMHLPVMSKRKAADALRTRLVQERATKIQENF